MKQSKVLKILGEPIKSEFTKDFEEWHYCTTGQNVDQFIALFFHKNKLVATTNYTTDASDGGPGDCSIFIKRGDYREPDTVKELKTK
jgi:hypothetical protein